MTTPDPATSFEEWNEVMARRYDPERYHASSSLIIRTIERLRTRRILSLADAGPGAKVLDLGCGPGHMLASLRAAGAEGWGVDLSRWLLDKASTRLGQSWGEGDAPASVARLVHGDVQALPEAIRRHALFDIAICSEVLEHVPRPRDVFMQAAQVVRPGGRFVVSVPNEPLIDAIKAPLASLRLLGRLFPGVAPKMGDEWHLHEFDLARLRAEAQGLGWVERRVVAVPAFALPIRWVALFERVGG